MSQPKPREFWIVWKSGYRNQATVTVDKPKEYNDSLTHVIAKEDFQPKIDELKNCVISGGEYEFRLWAEMFLKAWDGK